MMMILVLIWPATLGPDKSWIIQYIINILLILLPRYSTKRSLAPMTTLRPGGSSYGRGQVSGKETRLYLDYPFQSESVQCGSPAIILIYQFGFHLFSLPNCSNLFQFEVPPFTFVTRFAKGDNVIEMEAGWNRWLYMSCLPMHISVRTKHCVLIVR